MMRCAAGAEEVPRLHWDTSDVPGLQGGDGTWDASIHKISDKEKKTSLDIQFVKQKPILNNNIVVYLTNQYGVSLPFYTAPIGGIRQFESKLNVKPAGKK
jgi:hypothetical protein